MAESVRIVIKNPTQSTDHRLEAPLNSTVGDLKQKLSQQYVNNPAPSSQKLIFAGRLLQDEAILSDILRQVRNIYNPHNEYSKNVDRGIAHTHF